ncbi:MAG: AcrR family transcriptional regulator [Arenicella sp.]|jgi:AcrR family transcriptional regulator
MSMTDSLNIIDLAETSLAGAKGGVHGQQKQKKYANKKLLAIEAAAKVFADKGFHGATTQDIAEVMGIQQGSLYYYFKSKEQALQEVCEYGFDLYVERMKKICAKDQPFEAKMMAIITSHLTNYSQKDSAMKVHNEQRLYLPVERRSRIKDLGTSYRKLLESTLSEGIDAGVLRADINTHFIAYSIIGICNSWGANLIRDESINVFETIEQCSDLILYGTLKKNVK